MSNESNSSMQNMVKRTITNVRDASSTVVKKYASAFRTIPVKMILVLSSVIGGFILISPQVNDVFGASSDSNTTRVSPGSSIFMKANQGGNGTGIVTTTTPQTSKPSSMTNLTSIVGAVRACLRHTHDELNRGDIPVASTLIAEADAILASISGNMTGVHMPVQPPICTGFVDKESRVG